MKKYIKISKELGARYILQAIAVVTGFFLFSILTRYLTIKEYGFYSLIIISLNLMVGGISLGIPNFIHRDLTGRSNRYKITQLSKLNSFYIISIIVYLVIFVVFYLLNFSWVDRALLVYLFIAVMLSYYTAIFVAYLSAKIELIKSNTLNYFLLDFWYVIIIIYTLIFKKLDMNTIFLIKAIILLVVTTLLLKFVKDKKKIFKFAFDKIYLSKALRYGLPFVPLLIAQWVITASDRYVIRIFSTNFEVGLYAYAYTLIAFISVVGKQVGAILSTYMMEAANKKKKETTNFLFNASIKYSMMIVFPAIGGVLALQTSLVSIISGDKYLSALFILPVLAPYPIFRMINVSLQNILMINNKTVLLGKIYVVGMIVNIILNLLLIPTYGIMGAAIATISTYIFLSILFILSTRGSFKLDWNFLRIGRLFLSSFIMFIILIWLRPQGFFWVGCTVILGMLIYFGSLFVLKGFVKEELRLIIQILKSIKKSI